MSCAKWIECILNTQFPFLALMIDVLLCGAFYLLHYGYNYIVTTPRVRTLRVSTFNSAINTSRKSQHLISQGHKPSKKHLFHHLEHRSTTAAKRHLHFLLDMLALVILGLRSLLRFNHFFLRNKHPHNRCTRHQPMTTPNASHLQIEKTHSEN